MVLAVCTGLGFRSVSVFIEGVDVSEVDSQLGKSLVRTASITLGLAVITLLWWINDSFLVKRLRKPDVLIHHVAMAAVAGVGAFALPVRYGLFYLGVSELSSLPLLAYDQLSAMTEGREGHSGDGDGDNNNMSNSTLLRLREIFKVAAAAAFTVVRAYLFTKVTFFEFLPDVRRAIPFASPRQATWLRFFQFTSVGFAALQLAWFAGIVKAVVGGGGGGEGDGGPKIRADAL